MASFLEIKQDVVRYVRKDINEEEVLAVAGGAVIDAIRKVNVRNWSWQNKSHSFGFSEVSGIYYNLPEDFRTQRQLNLLYADGTIAGTIGYKDPKTFDGFRGVYNDSGAGYPQCYTVFSPYVSGQLVLDKAPNASFIEQHPSGELRYFARVVEPALDADPITVPPEVEHVIRWFAKSQMAARYDRNSVEYAEKRWTEQWVQLERDENSRDFADWF